MFEGVGLREVKDAGTLYKRHKEGHDVLLSTEIDELFVPVVRH